MNNVKATTFNAAGINESFAKRNGYSLETASSLIDAVRFQGDPLSTAQDDDRTLAGRIMPDGVGRDYWIRNRNAGDAWTPYHLVPFHSMAPLIKGLRGY